MKSFPILLLEEKTSKKQDNLPVDERNKYVFKEKNDPNEFLKDKKFELIIVPCKMDPKDKEQFRNSFNKLCTLFFDKKITLNEINLIIQEIFFKKEEKSINTCAINEHKPVIDWLNPKKIEKYVYFFYFIKNKICSQRGTSKRKTQKTVDLKKDSKDYPSKRYLELYDFYTKEFSGKSNNLFEFDFDELNRVIRYYFTTDSDVFVQGIIPNLKEFHGKSDELEGILSICNESPNIEYLAQILKCDTYSLDSVFNLCKFYCSENIYDKIEILKINEIWVKNLNIDLKEFIFVIKFVFNMIDPFDYAKFISTFGLDNYIDNSVLQSIFSIFVKPENVKDDLETYQKIIKERKVIFEAINVHETLGNIFVKLQQAIFGI